ncbi:MULTISPECIES: FAD:protein FMN transferase [unclassified Companilactobacillus]|jgi:thiamine biosynthesis lipoprotein|uniref:FAD:protein FMN transferase n=1 Tax=unclassified Companilactobacillus TaxID=2767904 RepID=UPI002FF1AD0C
MTEYKYLNVTLNKFDEPFEMKLATPKNSTIEQNAVDQAVDEMTKKISEYAGMFSLENKDSLLARFQDGEEGPLMISKAFREVYEQTITAEQMTQHYFSSYYNGKYDPVGLLDGWMIDNLFNKYLLGLLKVNGIDGVSLRCGEDVRLASRPDIDFRWRVEIKNPNNEDNLLATYFLQNGSVSTSKSMRSLRSEKSNVEQVTIVNNNALDANIWSNAGISAGTNKFPEFVTKYHLTGMLVDKNEGLINFRDGISNKIAVKK